MIDDMAGFLVGDAPFRSAVRTPRGALVSWRGRPGYRIDDVDGMPPFLVSVVSAGDRWLYASSRGALVAGRRDPDGALFPYETDDRVLARDGRSGGRTVVFVQRREEPHERRWEPLLTAADGAYEVSRSLWKSRLGDDLVLEEVNKSLGLAFRVSWSSGERFGFQRRVELENQRDSAALVRVLDGLVDVQAADIDRGMQQGLACLVDAYRYSELDETSGIAHFRLSSIPIDRAVPSETLRANVAWVRGLDDAALLLSSNQLEAFRRGGRVMAERVQRGRPGALLASATLQLAPGATRVWTFGADVGLDAASVARLAGALGPRASSPSTELAVDLVEDRERLAVLVAAADGEQRTSEPLHDARHAANVLFNIMRGGTFLDDGRFTVAQFERYLRGAAPAVAHVMSAFLEEGRSLRGARPAQCRAQLVGWAVDSGDPDLERLAREFLPLTFSRRHGDPSRPWNRFSIQTHDADGRPALRYEGNWRDIFQNWEALLAGTPDFAEAAVFKFLDCSTADGFNPYRVNSEGCDWEVPDAADPWAHIGYWGDHQIVYLQRLLDLAERTTPGALARHLIRRIFVYVDVPYRLAGFDALLASPRETIQFDLARHRECLERVPREGNEARLLRLGSGALARANLAEKLLVPVLAKLAQFIPGLGVWMNTQRPEWNDANNALVGQGVSVVTTAQLYRHLATLRRLIAQAAEFVDLDEAVAQHLAATRAAFAGDPVRAATDPAERRRILTDLGRAGERYRVAVYSRRVGGDARTTIARCELLSFIDVACAWLGATLAANRRDDGLWNAYNLLVVHADGGLGVRRLAPMLEGQVAVLGSGALSPDEALATLDALRASPLWRADLGTYLLYPDRALAPFCDHGALSEESLARLSNLDSLLNLSERAPSDDVLRRGPDGIVRFAPGLANAAALAARLDELATDSRLAGLVATNRQPLLTAYEETFDHAAFTGRSGSFFGYEGLGCVYWHMVSKLRLALAETIVGCEADPQASTECVSALCAHYADVRRGLGVEAEPVVVGAVPTDPYSHTPAHGGARQPGMTGQVKEDILARWLELGIRVREGRLSFVRSPLWKDPSGSFSYCGVPVTVRAASRGRTTIRVHFADGRAIDAVDGVLDRETSAAILGRDETVRSLHVDLEVDLGR